MDDLDKRILVALQANARTKNSELARDLGIAPSTVLERIRRLEEHGFIQGYRGVISPAKLGLAVQAFAAISLDRHEVDTIQKFEQEIQQIPHVRVCHHLAGRFDYLLHMAARDLEQLGELIKNQIASIPGIGRVETLPIYSEVKSDQGWSIGKDLAIENLTTTEDKDG